MRKRLLILSLLAASFAVVGCTSYDQPYRAAPAYAPPPPAY